MSSIAFLGSVFPEAVVAMAVAGVVVLWMLGMVAVFATCYKRVPPDRALVIFGKGRMFDASGRRRRIARGGGVFVFPIIESCAVLELAPVPFDWASWDQIAGNAMVRVGDSAELADAAVRSVLAKTPAEIGAPARQIVEAAALRVLDADPRPERVAAEEALRQAAAAELNKLGLEFVSISVHTLAKR